MLYLNFTKHHCNETVRFDLYISQGIHPKTKNNHIIVRWRKFKRSDDPQLKHMKSQR